MPNNHDRNAHIPDTLPQEIATSRDVTAPSRSVRRDARSHLPSKHQNRPDAIDATGQVVRVSETPIPRLENPAHIYLDSLQTPAGARSRMYLLNRLARMLGSESYESVFWQDLRTPVIRRILAELRDDTESPVSPVTRNIYLSTIKAVSREAWMMGVMELEVFEKIRTIPPIRHESVTSGRAYDFEMLQAIITAARDDGTPTARRNTLIIAFMSFLGLRRQEVTKVHISDINFLEKELTVQGKGNKQRILTFPTPVWEELISYLDAERGYDSGALFCPYWNKRSTPKINDEGLDVTNINYILKKARLNCHDLIGQPVTPHDLRRSFATELHDRGMSVREIQVLLGHANSSTTETYVRDDKDGYRGKAAKLLGD